MLFIGIILIIVAIIVICVRQFSTTKRYEQLISSGKQKIGELVQQITEMKKELGELGEDNTTAMKLTAMGTAKCDAPLTSPLGNIPCIYYKMSVTSHWIETYREDGQTKTRRRSEVLESHENSTRFKIEDETGSVEVDPTDGSFEGLRKSVDKSEVMRQSLPSLSFGNFHLNLGNLPAMSGGAPETIEYHEEVIDVNRRVTVVGTLCDKMGDLLIEKHEKTPVIVSTKSSDEMIKDTQSTLKTQLIVTGICGILGLILTIIGAFQS